MDISKYGADFHDGSLYAIHHQGDAIEFTLSSAEMDPDDMKDQIPFSSDDTLKGKLHVAGVKQIRINNKPYDGVLSMIYDDGTVFDFVVERNRVELQIIWSKIYPRPSEEVDFWTIKIDCERAYWEPIPDLVEL